MSFPSAAVAASWALSELSWALSLVVAAPVAGFLLENANLQAVFGFSDFVSCFGDRCALDPGWNRTNARMDRFRRIGIINPLVAMRMVSAHPSAVYALFYTLCLTLAHEIFYINYGLWMEDAFGLVLTALGTITIVIAVAEVIGEFIVIGFSDRLGARNMSMYSMLLAAASFFGHSIALLQFAPGDVWDFCHVHQHRNGNRIRYSHLY